MRHRRLIPLKRFLPFTKQRHDSFASHEKARPAQNSKAVPQWQVRARVPSPPVPASGLRRNKVSPPLPLARPQLLTDPTLHPARAVPHLASATATRLHPHLRAPFARHASAVSSAALIPPESAASLPQPHR